MRRVRLDEDDLISFLRPVLEEQGYIAEGHEILGFEYKTRRIKRGGDYYRDGVKDGEYPPEGVDEVKWIKVLIGPARHRRREPDDADGEEGESDGVAAADAVGAVQALGGCEARGVGSPAADQG